MNNKFTEQQIRAIVDRWCASIPHHEHQAIGSEMTIREIEEGTIQNVAIYTQFEQREVNSSHRRIGNTQLSSNTYSKASEINPWNYTFNPPTHYSKQEDSCIASESKHIDTCCSCHGRGNVTCPKCKNGRVNCPNCNGRGKINYTKKETCSKCKGKGYNSYYRDELETYYPSVNEQRKRLVRVEKKDPCFPCEGTGIIEKKVEETCSTCHGRGDVECKHCHGKGDIICHTCMGDKKLLYYANVVCKWNYTHDQIGCSTFITSEEIDIALDDVPLKEWECIKVIKASDGKLDQSQISALNECVEEAELELLRDAHNQLDGSNKILFEQIDIYEIGITYIEYSYEGDEYGLGIVHDSQNVVVADDSPIKNAFQDLLEKAISAGKKKNYNRALTLIEKCNDFPQAGKDEEEFKEEITELMEEQVTFGAKIGLQFAGLFIALFGFYYYHNYNYVLKCFDFVNFGVYAHASLLNIVYSIFFSYIIYERLEDKMVRKLRFFPKGRVFLGFTTTVMISVGVGLSFVLLNFLGLTSTFNLVLGGLIALLVQCIGMLISLAIVAIQFIIDIFF